MSATEDVRGALDEFDRVFGSGDADALASLFAIDAQLLLLHGEPFVGRAAIREHWRRFADRYDPAAWQSEHVIIDVHEDRAYALSIYSEVLVPRMPGPRISVAGRLILFLHREADGAWRVTLAMNSHSRPMQELEP